MSGVQAAGGQESATLFSLGGKKLTAVFRVCWLGAIDAMGKELAPFSSGRSRPRPEGWSRSSSRSFRAGFQTGVGFTMTTMALQGKTILLGVSGGIAAYKAAMLTRLLKGAGARVRVAMSEAAGQFVTPLTFQALSGEAVFSSLWEAGDVASGMAHITLSREADAMLVAPATADFMARAATGQADDLLSTLALARNCPLFLAPSMNRQMWRHPATQRNAATLAEDGVVIWGPTSGKQACGEDGEGRLLEPEQLLEALTAALARKTLAGKKVLLTAGPTFEAIDPVRGLTNRSSGKMGYALARAAFHAGATVTLVSGPVAIPFPYGVTGVPVISAAEMQQAVLTRAADADIFIAVAAVADYHVKTTLTAKHKKEHGVLPTLDLVENPDILASVAALHSPPFCVGFAAESEDLARYAEEKRRRKRLPLIVGNLVQEGLGGDSNHVVLFDDHGAHALPTADKHVLARQLIDHIAALMETAHARVN
jgi:phosphopantothenoylcysteine decarboxylase/phosphopantothenate--cysteine ligase